MNSLGVLGHMRLGQCFLTICSPPCPLKHLVKTQQVTTITNIKWLFVPVIFLKSKNSPLIQIQYVLLLNLEAISSSSFFTKIFRKLQIMPWSTYSIFLSDCLWESNCHEYLQIHIFIKPGTQLITNFQLPRTSLLYFDTQCMPIV